MRRLDRDGADELCEVWLNSGRGVPCSLLHVSQADATDKSSNILVQINSTSHAPMTQQLCAALVDQLGTLGVPGQSIQLEHVVFQGVGGEIVDTTAMTRSLQARLNPNSIFVAAMAGDLIDKMGLKFHQAKDMVYNGDCPRAIAHCDTILTLLKDAANFRAPVTLRL